MQNVFLNVYNLFDTNYCFSRCGLGIYHTTVEINGKEYSFGGNLGLSILPKGSINLKLHEQIFVGNCYKSDDNILLFINNLKIKYSKSKYHYLLFNCNSFSNEFLYLLCNYNLPFYIDRIPRCLAKFSCLKNTNKYMCNIHNFTKVSIDEDTNNFINDFEYINLDESYDVKIQI